MTLISRAAYELITSPAFLDGIIDGITDAEKLKSGISTSYREAVSNHRWLSIPLRYLKCCELCTDLYTAGYDLGLKNYFTKTGEYKSHEL
jgi:hypothetical protein